MNTTITKSLKLLISISILSLSLICFYLFVYNDTSVVQNPVISSVKKNVNTSNLLAGDILFWKVKDQENRAGHVAVIISSDDTKHIRIAHATDNPKYNAFVETYLPPSEKIKKQDRYYFVLRIKDSLLRENFLKIIQDWLSYKIPFNAEHEALMNKWDDSMVAYSTNIKVMLQNLLFSENNILQDQLPSDGFMCSEIIIIALQKAYFLTYGQSSQLPSSLKVDPILCPPSTMMLALCDDQQNFVILGELYVF